MQIPIRSTADLGLVVRATRKAQRLRIDDLARFADLGPVFAMDVEHGKPTVQFGRVLRLLEQLGIRLTLDMPDAAAPGLEVLRERGLRPRRKGARRSAPGDKP